MLLHLEQVRQTRGDRVDRHVELGVREAGQAIGVAGLEQLQQPLRGRVGDLAHRRAFLQPLALVGAQVAAFEFAPVAGDAVESLADHGDAGVPRDQRVAHTERGVDHVQRVEVGDALDDELLAQRFAAQLFDVAVAAFERGEDHRHAEQHRGDREHDQRQDLRADRRVSELHRRRDPLRAAVTAAVTMFKRPPPCAIRGRAAPRVPKVACRARFGAFVIRSASDVPFRSRYWSWRYSRAVLALIRTLS